MIKIENTEVCALRLLSGNPWNEKSYEQLG